MTRQATFWFRAACAGLALLLASCGGEPPRRPNVMHPVHERRAVEIVGRTFRDQSLDPAPPQTIKVADGKPLRVDVVASGHKYGVAYLTRDDEAALGQAVPKFDPDSDALIIVDGSGTDEGWHVVVLYDRAYLSDDLEGESHGATSIAAEGKIARDARDFLVKAQHEGWP